jgi:hypothetical protein
MIVKTKIKMTTYNNKNLSDCFISHLRLLKLNEFPCTDTSVRFFVIIKLKFS